MPSVSSILVKHLVKWGVTHVFGIPGKPVTLLVFEMDQQGIKFVLSKHECGAGFEAAGYAMMRNSLGVAVGTAGPGGINMLTAAGQAQATNLPVLFITGQPPIKEIGKVLGQDSTMFGTDLVKMFEPVTKFSARIDRGELFKSYLEHAIEQAFTGTRGPVHLSIPLDVLMEQIETFELELPDKYPTTIASNLDEVVSLIEAAKRPLLFVGGAVHGQHAYEELEAFANKWQLPVATTPGGKGAFRSNHPLSLGAMGLGGSEITEDYLDSGIDLMIVVGSQLSDLETPGIHPAVYPKHVIHFDQDPRFIGKALPIPTTPVLGNLKSNLRALIEYSAATPVQEDFRIVYDEAATAIDAVAACAEVSDFLSGEQLMQILREELPDDAMVFGDAGSHSFYAIKYFDIEVPGTFYFDEVFATMGRAIGYAVGAKFGQPDRTMVAITGDGCMFMAGTEVSTAVNYDAPVIFIVANNQSIDMVDKGMARHLGKAVGTTYRVPLDATKFGQSMGADAYRCCSENELREATRKALMHNNTVVIEVMMDPYEMPPTMKRG
jgi:acetolactate synthase-1/2/3 large subunit